MLSELVEHTILPAAPSRKPVLIIMNNVDGSHPLWPYTEQSIGWRLWKMLTHFTGATQKEYLSTFERICMTESRKWDIPSAMKVAPEILVRLKGRERVVILGVDTLKALTLFHSPRYYRWTQGEMFKWILTPHPSGRNKIYADPIFTLITASLLAELYNEYRGGVV